MPVAMMEAMDTYGPLYVWLRLCAGIVLLGLFLGSPWIGWAVGKAVLRHLDEKDRLAAAAKAAASDADRGDLV